MIVYSIVIIIIVKQIIMFMVLSCMVKPYISRVHPVHLMNVIEPCTM